MKCSIVLLLVIFSCYVEYSSTLSLVEPIRNALERNLNPNLIPSEEACPDNYKEIAKLKFQAARTFISLENKIFEKLPNKKSSDGLEDLINQDCINDDNLKTISQRVVTNVQKCLDENKKLNRAKEEELEKEIIETICFETKSMITWRIQMTSFSQSN